MDFLYIHYTSPKVDVSVVPKSKQEFISFIKRWNKSIDDWVPQMSEVVQSEQSSRIPLSINVSYIKRVGRNLSSCELHHHIFVSNGKENFEDFLNSEKSSFGFESLLRDLQKDSLLKSLNYV